MTFKPTPWNKSYSSNSEFEELIADKTLVDAYVDEINSVFTDAVNLKVISFTTNIVPTVEEFVDRRKRNRSPNWPSTLSKKEFIVCKLKYLESILQDTIALECEDNTRNSTAIKFIETKIQLLICIKLTLKHIMKPTEKTPNGQYIKFKGLNSSIVKILNTINVHIVPEFKKYSFEQNL